MALFDADQTCAAGLCAPDPSFPTYDSLIPQSVLFSSGGPTLMIPYIHNGPLDANHAGIAWDGSRLAARALRDARPFLTAAHAVTIIAVNEEVIPRV
jgi:hypothetical protein